MSCPALIQRWGSGISHSLESTSHSSTAAIQPQAQNHLQALQPPFTEAKDQFRSHFDGHFNYVQSHPHPCLVTSTPTYKQLLTIKVILTKHVLPWLSFEHCPALSHYVKTWSIYVPLFADVLKHVFYTITASDFF